MKAFNLLLANPDWENSVHSAYLKRRKIVFLPKKGKDPTRVENYRPISLLETVYKLVSKFLIEEIQEGVFRVASPNQFGFIPTRLMSNCSLTLLALIKKLKEKFPDAFLLFVDIQTAFDSAKPELIHSLLNLLYPKSNVPMLIAKLNRACRGEVCVNGVSGPLIRLTRGTGQGDPASTVKFTVDHQFWIFTIHQMIETSTTSLRQLMIEYQDVVHPSHEIQLKRKIPRGHPTVAFADDTTMAMRTPANRQAAAELKEILHELEEVTGLKVNPSKSEILLLYDNPTDEQKEILADFGTIKEHVTHLGVTISQDYAQARKLIYESGKTAMKKASSRISGEISSTNLIMKAQAVNVVVSAVNNHRFRIFPPTTAEIDEIWKLARKALWTTRKIGGGETIKHKISQDKVVRSLDNGGLALIHPKQAAATSLVASVAGFYRHS